MKSNRWTWLVLAWASALPAAEVPAYTIQTVAGSSSMGDGGPAIAAQFGIIQGVALNSAGNTLYVSDTANNRVRLVDLRTGIVTTYAGNGTAGLSGDGGPATAAQLNHPYGLAVDKAGDLYIADYGNNLVRMASPDGTIATIAGTGVEGYQGEDGLAAKARLYAPRNLALDAAGNLYISEFEGHRVRKVTPATATSPGVISTVAGTGIAGYNGDGGIAIMVQLNHPAGLAVDASGALYIADSQNDCVRTVLPNGIMYTAVKPGASTPAGPQIDPNSPASVVVVQSLIVVSGWASPIVNAFPASGAALGSSFAGQGTAGFSGDGGPATSAELMQEPHDLAIDPQGNVFIADGMRVREVNAAGIVSTVAGDGYRTTLGDGALATSAVMYQPSAVAFDSSGDLFISDTGTERVRIVLTSGNIMTLAGNGIAGYTPDGVAATAAELNAPMGLAMDPSNHLFVADTNNERVREISAGTIYTFAGTGTAGRGNEGLAPGDMPLYAPRGVCIGSDGSVYIADTNNSRVLVAPPGGVVTTFAGNGSPGYTGDGDLAPYSQLNLPSACALDGSGDLYIADTGNHTVREVSGSTGAIATVAGTGACGFSGDGDAATSAALCSPGGVAADGNGNIFIADTGNHAIRMVTPDGAIHTIAGQGTPGFSGDGGPAVSASLSLPSGMLLDGAGNLYFADSGNNRVRRLTPPGGVVTVGPPPVGGTLALVGAASLSQGPVAPGEIVTIYGTGIGPAAGVAGSADASGRIGSLLAGAQVTFDGVAAPLFYAQASQINAQVPYTIAGETFTQMEVTYQGQSVGTLNLAVAPSAPGLFAAALNQDGSLNSATARAARGTVVTFFGTGEGLTNGPNIAGAAAVAPYPAPVLPVTLTVDAIAAQLLYAGEAPGFSGLLQVDAVMPGGFVPSGAVAVQLTVGVSVSPPITVWLQ
ncbi:MAG: hypothetical protein ACLQKA_07165 [Bryobacteraceae bacterium]